MKRAFTLLEMLITLGIIAILIAASVAGYTKAVSVAQRGKTQELVTNAATALASLFIKTGSWPKILRTAGASDGVLDAQTALPIAGNYMSLSLSSDGQRLVGSDRFGVLTPQAVTLLKTKHDAKLTTPVTANSTIQDHLLHFAIDLNGDGEIKANVGGEVVRIRATAAVWCIGRDGGDNGKPWPYSKGLRKGDVYSWTVGQTKGW